MKLLELRVLTSASARPGSLIRWLRLLGAALVVLAALVAYSPALAGGWIWDDDQYVTQNPHVRSPEGLRAIWTLQWGPVKRSYLPNTPQYYPFVFTSFWIEHGLFGLQPAVFHATNLLLHLVNAWLVWKLARRLEVPAAGLVAALFALHPMHVESVAWVTERKNVLSGLFYLSSFLAFLRFDEKREGHAYALSLVLYVAALLSKSVTATLPLLLLLALFWRHKRLGAREVLLIAPFFVLGAVSGAATAHFERVYVGAEGGHFAETALERWLFVAPRAFCHYAWKTLWPYQLAFIYSRWDARTPGLAGWLFPAAVALGLLASVLVRKRAGWGPALLVFASAVTLAPALGLVPVYPHRFSWVADHFAYLGSLPLIALYVTASLAALRRVAPASSARWLGATLAAVLLALFTWRAHDAARSYASPERLWTDTLNKTPDAWIAMINLGIEQMNTAPVTPERQRSALELFERAEAFPLGRVQALTNQGIWYLRLKRPGEAIEPLRRALAEDANYERAVKGLTSAHFARASAQLAEGRHADALAACAEGLRDLGASEPLLQLRSWIQSTSADERLRDGRTARVTAELLLVQKPDDPGLLDTLAAACAEAGDFEAAVRHAQAALALADPQIAAPIRERLERYRAGHPHREETNAPGQDRGPPGTTFIRSHV